MAYFADIVLGYFNSGTGPFPGPYGQVDLNGNGIDDPGESALGPISLNAVLGDDPGPSLDFVSLPTGSYVSVGFQRGFVIDGPGNDVFIRETGAAGDRANVYVSSLASPTAQDFVFLGTAQDNVTTALDLASINFTQPVRAIKIVGLDNNGAAPGFDVVNVQALQVLTARGDRIISGSSGNDFIRGGDGNDQLTGNEGDDVLVGIRGNDTLFGNDGNDKLLDGKGNDYLDGGAGSDKIFCGAGRDLVVLQKGRLGRDLVNGFKDRQDRLGLPQGIKFDRLKLEQLGNNTLISFSNASLALLRGVDASLITRADFKSI